MGKQGNKSPEGPESNRRRIKLIRELFENGEIDIRSFEKERNDEFVHSARPTLDGDLKAIEKLLSNERWHILARVKRGLRVTMPEQFWFDKKVGYEIDPAPESETEQKAKVGRYIVDHLLSEDDAVYFGVGTAVFQTAVALLRTETKRAQTVLTHNLAIVDLWRHQGGYFPRNYGIELVILGGKANYAKADIVTGEVSQLEHQSCTKCVLGCDWLKPISGEICSNDEAEAELKRKVLSLEKLRHATLIIPITASKISRQTGGHHIRLRTEADDREQERDIIVVTTTITPEDQRALDQQRIKVRVTG